MIAKLYLFTKDTDANASVRGYQYQILKTLETWLENYHVQLDEEIYCDYEEDIFQRNTLTQAVRFRQLKLYSRNFSFQSEEIKKALAHFFMLHVKTDYQNQDKEFVFEANSRVADYRKGNETDLLRNWVTNQGALPDELLEVCAQQVKTIVAEYVQERAIQLTGKVREEDLQEAMAIFTQLQEKDWLAFTRSIKWRFEDVSADQEFSQTIAHITELVAGLPSEAQPDSLFGILYKHVALASSAPNPEDRKLTLALLTSLLLRAGTEQDQWYEEVLRKWQQLEQPADFRLGEFFEVIQATKYCRWSKNLRAHDAFWLGLLDWYLANEAAAQFRQNALYERIYLQLQANDYHEAPQGTLHGSEEFVREYFACLPTLVRAADFENALSLLFIAFAAAGLGKAQLTMEEVGQWFQDYKKQLEHQLVAPASPSEQCALLACSSTLQFFGYQQDRSADRVARIMAPLELLLLHVGDADFFDVGQLSARLNTHVQQLIQHGDEEDETLIEAFEAYLQRLDTFVQRTEGAHKAAKREVARGVEYLKSAQPASLLKALRHFHKAKDLWLQQQTMDGYVLAVLNIAQVYMALSMPLAAKYYALWAIYTSVHNDDRSLLRRIAQGAGLLFAADYKAGAWISAMTDFERYISARHKFDPEPFDAQTDTFAQKIILQYGFILYAAPLLSPQLQGLATYKLGMAGYLQEDFLSPLLHTLQHELPADKLPEALVRSVNDSPLNDLGLERVVAFEVLGLTWRIAFPNTYQFTAVGEELGALLQILLVEIALSKTDFHLPRTVVEVRLLLSAEVKAPEQLPDDTKYVWQVFVPEVDSPNAEDIKMGIATATIALRTILDKISLLPEAEFEHAFNNLFTEQAMAGKTLQVNSYQRMYRSLLNADEYEEWRRQDYQPLPPIAGSPAPNVLLPWVSEVSAKYDSAAVQRHIQGRFRAMTPRLHLTLAHLQREAGYAQWLADLRAEGWLDWQIIMAMFNVVLNYKVLRELSNQGLDPRSEDYRQAMHPAFERYQSRDERDCYLPFSLDIFQSQDFRQHLEHTVVYGLKSLGLENKASIPNVEAVRGFLQTRFNLQHDTPDELNPLLTLTEPMPATRPEDIAQAWLGAVAVRFMPRPSPQQPAAVILAFEQADQGNYGYELLLDTYSNFTTILYLRMADNRLQLSLSHTATGAIISLPELRYDPSELAAFTAQQPADEGFALMTGYEDGIRVAITPSRSPFRPFVVTAYRYEPPHV